uniref:PGG domain-containing protein n=1 Tax=Oryza glumipatula TaxID=40148 RepID=A0A0E0A8F7_9ORYZ
MENSEQERTDSPLEYDLRKYLLLLATLVATVTYGAGFSPPGGVWQDTEAGHLAGDSIIRDSQYRRYLMFFYCNATAFALSIVVIILIFILAILHEKGKLQIPMLPLRAAMVLDLLSLMGAYAAGTSRGVLTAGNVSALVATFIYMVAQMVVTLWLDKKQTQDISSGDEKKKRHRKVLMLLATFVASITYIAGLSAPGGYWDNNQEGHHPGDPVLWEHHSRRLRAFFVCNTIAFVASLLIIMLLLDKKQRIFLPLDKIKITITVRTYVLYAYITIALLGLVGAYVAGSCRKPDTTIYVLSLVGAVLLCIGALQAVLFFLPQLSNISCLPIIAKLSCSPGGPSDSSSRKNTSSKTDILEKAQSLVVLLATLVATVTYQAGLVPPGGVWQKNQDGHMAGEPILLSTQAKRYKVFFYCNSTAFAASLVVIVLVRYKPLLRRRILEITMILDLFGLMGAYAAGSCRDITTSVYIIALAGGVLVYVVIHVVFFTLEDNDKEKEVGNTNSVRNGSVVRTQNNSAEGNLAEKDSCIDKRRKRLLLFTVLGATLTYQAGLTPPGGFRVVDDGFGRHAGDPILFYNFPRRYKAFLYCNSVSFMSSLSLIILLVNPNLYRPAIQSYALSVCTAAGLFALLGAYAAGSTQHLKTSIYVFVLVAVVLFIMIILLVCFYQSESKEKRDDISKEPVEKDKDRAKYHAKRKYLMLLGVLAASVTYQAGLNPPGGVWQGNSDGHGVGHSVMHDNKRYRYLTFFYSNSTSFVASIVVIILLLPTELLKKNRWLRVMNITIVLDLLGLLLAYVAGSSMRWEPSGYVIAFVIGALGCAAIHKFLSFVRRSQQQGQGNDQPSRLPEGGSQA